MFNILKILLIFIISLQLASCVAGAAITTGASAYYMSREKTISESVDDSYIETVILSQKMKLVGDYSRVNNEVYQGYVLLTGAVGSEKELQSIKRAIKDIEGVKAIANELKIENALTMRSESDRIKSDLIDQFINIAAKARLFVASGVKMRNYQISTHDQKLYIIGTAKNKEELKKVTAIASTTQGVRVVVSYIQIKS